MYLEEENSPKIVEVMDDSIDLDLDIKGPINPYLELCKAKVIKTWD